MVARRKGWGGDPPFSDDEARSRIVAAATTLICDRPSALLLADVADSLSVARQTVYKYFSSADELVAAAAMAEIDTVMDRIVSRVHGARSPEDAVVDGMVTAVEIVSGSAVLRHAFRFDPHAHLARAVVSEHTRAYGVMALRQTGVPWSSIGYTPADLENVAELALRLLQSLLMSPETSDPSGGDLRETLVRWVAPAVAAMANTDLCMSDAVTD